MRALRFTTRQFQIEANEHPDVYGNQLRAWLSAKLGEKNLPLVHEKSPHAGWGCFMFHPIPKAKLWIVVNHDYDPQIDEKIAQGRLDEIIWSLAVYPECSLWTGLLDRKRIKTASAQIHETLEQILSEARFLRQKDI